MNVSAQQLLPLIVLLPLIGAFVNGFLGARFSRRLSYGIGVGTVAVSFILALRCVSALSRVADASPLDPNIANVVYTWVVTGMFQFDVAFYLDPLSAVMLLVVTGVGLLIHIYSMGYMSEDKSYARYFAYLNLFMFSMLCLILGKNLLMLFVGWEGVGVCSYLLIGFWFSDDAKAQAGQKAFVVNRIGDFGFIIGMILLLYHAGGTTDYDVLRWRFEEGPWGPFHDPMTLTACCLLMFVGACGKSAQIPLYVWLPDAMAGPTPVSALIHAATMVTAGVYMIARMAFMFTLSPLAMGVVATVGACTALAAALMALTQRDIKGVLAYSTVSQLGYMVLAVGVGAYVAGIFHLMTHAFFKALLFLAAGSVIHGLAGEQDIFKMGGLKKKMPITRATFLVACLAIAGFPLMSGYFSKDAILWEVHSRSQLISIPEQAHAGFSDGERMIIGGKQGILLTHVGSGWERSQLPPTDLLRGAAKQRVLPNLRGSAVAPDGTEWVVSDYATVYKRPAGGAWERAWQGEDKLMRRHLNAVWAVGDSDVWFVGERGLVVHYDGKDFAVAKSNSLATLHSVAAVSATEVYAGGAGGTLLRWDGTTWLSVKSTGTSAITGMAVHDGTIWATTGQGALIKLGANGAFEKVQVRAPGIASVRQLTGLSAGGGLRLAGLAQREGETIQRPLVLEQTSDGWAASTGEPTSAVRVVGAAGGAVYAAGDGGQLFTAADGVLTASDTVPYKPSFHWILWIMGVLTAGLTAFYMFRLYFITFEGPTRCDDHTWEHAHESPPVMTVPLIILAVLSIGGGWISVQAFVDAVPVFDHTLEQWLAPVFRIADGRLAAELVHTNAAYAPTVLGLIAIGIAWMWYRAGIGAAPRALAQALQPLYKLSKNKFYVDEIYAAVIIGPYRFMAKVLYQVVDVMIVDGIIARLTAAVVSAGGSVLRLFQNGDVQRYAVGVVVGLAGVIWLMGL